MEGGREILSFEEERIVKVTFDNAEFKKSISDTIAALNKFEKSLDINPSYASQAFSALSDGARESEKQITLADEAVYKMKASLSALQIAGYTVFSELTRSAMNFGKQLYNSTLGQIKSGGLNRALNLESAKFQLEGLHVEWSKIQDDIDYAVNGTAYGLDAAAKVASQLSASQVQLGDEMKAALRGISGVAAMTNSSYEEIGDIFTAVAGKGRLMASELNRISQRGLNATQPLIDILQKKFPDATITTEAAVKDLVAKGKVSFKDFAEAMNEAFGEQATKANDTFTGAMSNMKAALSRIGAVFQSPWIEFKRQIYVSTIPVLKQVQKELQKFTQPVFQQILDMVSGIVTKLLESEDFLHLIYNITMGIYSWIHNIIRAVMELTDYQFPDIGSFVTALANMTDWMVVNGSRAEGFRNIIKGIIKSLSVVIEIVKAIIFILEPIWKPIIGFLMKLKDSGSKTNVQLDETIKKIKLVIDCIAVIFRYGLEKFIQIVIKAIMLLIKTIQSLGGVIGAIILVISTVVKVVTKIVNVIITAGDRILDVIKEIGTKLGWLLDTIKSVFVTAGSGIETFLTGVENKTSSLWSKVSGLFGNKKMTATVDVAANTPKIGPDEIVKQEATKSLNNQTKAVDNYNTATSKKVEIDQDNNPLGKHGVGPNLAVQSQLISNYKAIGEAAGIASKQIDVSSKSAADSLGTFSKASQKNFKEIDEAANGGDDKEEKKGIFAFFSKFGDKVQAFIAKSGPIYEKLAAHFTNFWSVVADAFLIGTAIFSVAVTVGIAKAVNALIGALNFLPEISKSLNNAAKGFKYQGLGEALKGMALSLLGLAAVIAVIGIIAKFVDPKAFQQVAIAVAALMGVQALILQAIGVFMLVGAIKTAIDKFGTGMTKTTTKMTAMSNMFKNLAILIGAIVGSILILYAVAEKTGGYGGILRIAGIIVGIMAAVMLLTTMMAKIVGDKSAVKSTKTLSLSAKTVSTNTESALGGCIALIRAIVPLMATLTASIVALSMVKDFNRLSAIFGLYMGMLVVILGGITGMMAVTAKVVANLTKDTDRVTTRTAGFKQLLQTINQFIMMMSGFMLSFAAAAVILSLIPKDKTAFVSKMMYTIVGTVAGVLLAIMGGLAIFMALDKKTGGKMEAQVTAFSKMISKIGGSMTAMISAISGLMIAMSVSIILLSTISDPARLDKAANTLLKMIISVGAMVVVLGLALRTFSMSHKKGKNDIKEINVKDIEATAQQITAIFGGMSMFMMTMASALAMLAIVDRFGDINKGIKAMVTMSVVMTLMTAVLLTMFRSFEQSYGVLNYSKDYINEGKHINKQSENVGKMMLQVMAGMSLFMGSMAVVMVALGKILTPEELDRVTNDLTRIMFVIGGTIVAVIYAISNLANKATKAKDTHLASMLKSTAAMILTVVGSIVLLMAAYGALVIALNSNKVSTKSIVAGTIALGAAIASIFGLYAYFNKHKINKPNVKSMAAVITIAVGMASLAMALAGVMKVISTIDFNLKTIGASVALLVVSIGLVALSYLMLTKLFDSEAIAALGSAIKGVAAIIAFSYAIIGMIAVAALTIKLIGECIYSFAESINNIKNLDWTGISDSVSQMKTAMIDIGAAFKDSMSLEIVLSALIFGVAMSYIISAFEKLKDIHPENTKALAEGIVDIFKVFAENSKTFFLASVVVAGIGLLFMFIALNLAVGMALLIAALAMVPVAVREIDVAVAAAKSVSKNIATNIRGIIDDFIAAFNGLGEEVNNIDYESLAVFGIFIMGFGIALAVGGVLMVVGALALMGGAALLKATVLIMGSVVESMEGYRKQLNRAKEYLQILAYISVGGIVAGLLLDTAATSLLAGAIQLIASVAILRASFGIMEKDVSRIDIIATYFGALMYVAGYGIAAGFLMVLGGAALAVGSLLFLVGAGALSLALMAMDYALSSVDIDYMTETIMSKLPAFFLALNGLSQLIVYTIGPVIAAAALIMVGSLLLSVAGVALLIGIGSFALTMIILSEMSDYINVDGIAETCSKLIEVMGSIREIGEIMFECMGPFLAGALMFSIAAGAFLVGVLLLGASFVIGAAALLAGLYILSFAFQYLKQIFDTMDLTEIAAAAGNIQILAILIGIAGIILSIGAIPFLIGAGLFLAASFMLKVGINLLTSIFTGGVMIKLIAGIGMFVAVANKFINVSGTLLKAGVIFVIVGGMILVGSVMILAGCAMVGMALQSLTSSVQDFVTAGQNIVDGIIEGIKEKASTLVDVITELAEGDVLGAFCEALGIESPARKFIEAAGNIIGGIVEGLGGDGEKVTEAITDVGNSALDKFDSFTDGFKSVGEKVGTAGGGGLVDSLINTVGEYLPGGLESIANMWGGGLSSIFGAGNSEMKAELMRQQRLLEEEQKKLAQKTVLTPEEQARLQEIGKDYQAIGNQIRILDEQKSPFEADIPSWEEYKSGASAGGSSGLPDDTANALADAGVTSTGSGSSSDLAKTAGNNVGTSITNNNYNFIQNNYSPEPIDRTELYVQTNNQLDTWYKFVRDNG